MNVNHFKWAALLTVAVVIAASSVDAAQYSYGDPMADSERMQFEAWASRHPMLSIAFRKGVGSAPMVNGNYGWLELQRAWEGWQARANMSRGYSSPMLPSIPDPNPAPSRRRDLPPVPPPREYR